MQAEIGYGKQKIGITIPNSKQCKIFEPKRVEKMTDFGSKFKQSLLYPFSSKPINELVEPSKKFVIVVDDISRPIPTQEILVPLLDVLVANKIPLSNVQVIVATGVHRPLHDDELNFILGRYAKLISIENHNPDDLSNLISIGKTSIGNEIKINRKFIETDLKIIIGDIEFHQFCGYGGGAKSIFPGLADRKSIERNHSRFTLKGADKGEWKNNPVRQEIEELYEMTSNVFLINVILNEKNEIIKIFSGDLRKAYLEGLRTIDGLFKATTHQPFDLILSSPGGYPRDIDLYQSQKALQSAAKIGKKNGKIVIIAECSDGFGSDIFNRTVKNANSLVEIIDNAQKEFVLGAHKAFQLARDILDSDVYIYSSISPKEIAYSFLKPITMEGIHKLIETSQSIAVLPYASTMHVSIVNDQNDS